MIGEAAGEAPSLAKCGSSGLYTLTADVVIVAHALEHSPLQILTSQRERAAAASFPDHTACDAMPRGAQLRPYARCVAHFIVGRIKPSAFGCAAADAAFPTSILTTASSTAPFLSVGLLVPVAATIDEHRRVMQSARTSAVAWKVFAKQELTAGEIGALFDDVRRWRACVVHGVCGGSASPESPHSGSDGRMIGVAFDDARRRRSLCGTVPLQRRRVAVQEGLVCIRRRAGCARTRVAMRDVQVAAVKVVDWSAYPSYSPFSLCSAEGGSLPFVIDAPSESGRGPYGVFHINPVESLASAMEMSMISARNVANLCLRGLLQAHVVSEVCA
jgi:hypothetical protein